MALVHPDATITPTKRELLDAWIPTRDWYDGTTDREPVGAYRFDDPAGEVGMEGFLLGSAGGSTLHVPLTYRSAPITGADDHLIAVMEHSVLGKRWVYDACSDPVFVQALATAILTGSAGAPMEAERDGVMTTYATSATVQGSGAVGTAVPAVGPVSFVEQYGLCEIHAGDITLTLVRVLGSQLATAHTLTATWKGGAADPIAGI